mmetsp:Transcript_18289/g.38435  ORF Transcript_18289/g.38435 Transcript_18289/m.38435 type:complete len:87 (-) Transcript_18289:1456-1716(-)
MNKGVVQRAKRIFYKAMGDYVVDMDVTGNRNDAGWLLDEQGNLCGHVSPDRTAISFGELIDSRLNLEHNKNKNNNKNKSNDNKKLH